MEGGWQVSVLAVAFLVKVRRFAVRLSFSGSKRLPSFLLNKLACAGLHPGLATVPVPRFASAAPSLYSPACLIGPMPPSCASVRPCRLPASATVEVQPELAGVVLNSPEQLLI